MSQRWRAVGNTASDLTCPRFGPQTPASETNASPLDQLASIIIVMMLNCSLHSVWLSYFDFVFTAFRPEICQTFCQSQVQIRTEKPSPTRNFLSVSQSTKTLQCTLNKKNYSRKNRLSRNFDHKAMKELLTLFFLKIVYFLLLFSIFFWKKKMNKNQSQKLRSNNLTEKHTL